MESTLLSSLGVEMKTSTARIRRLMVTVGCIALFSAIGCGDSAGIEPAEETAAESSGEDTNSVQRGIGDKGDRVVTGSCEASRGDHCGGKSDGSCWCDQKCANEGDCCSDAESVCDVKSNRHPNRVDKRLPMVDDEALEAVAELPYPPGNVTVSEGGRIFFSYYPGANHADFAIGEIVDGAVVPFPSDSEFQDALVSVLSLRAHDGKLWLLDHGKFGIYTPSLHAIDLETGERVETIKFPDEIADKGSQLNDFQISRDGDFIYIADQSPVWIFDKKLHEPGITVVDRRGDEPTFHRRLVGHPSVQDGPYDVFVDGKLVRAMKILRPDYGVDSITLGPKGRWLYYASLNMGELYRVDTETLTPGRDRPPHDVVEPEPEKVGDITLSDGITSDREGHIYITSIERFALTRYDTVGSRRNPDGKLEVLVQDRARLRWPDGLSWGPNGYLYVTASALHRHLPEIYASGDDLEEYAPYHILRLRPQEACSVDEDCVGRPGF